MAWFVEMLSAYSFALKVRLLMTPDLNMATVSGLLSHSLSLYLPGCESVMHRGFESVSCVHGWCMAGARVL